MLPKYKPGDIVKHCLTHGTGNWLVHHVEFSDAYPDHKYFGKYTDSNYTGPFTGFIRGNQLAYLISSQYIEDGPVTYAI